MFFPGFCVAFRLRLLLIFDIWKSFSWVNMVSLAMETSGRRFCFCKLVSAAVIFGIVFFVGSIYTNSNYMEIVSKWPIIGSAKICESTSENNLMSSQHNQANALIHESSLQPIKLNSCKNECRPIGTERLPKGITSGTSDLEMVPLWGPLKDKATDKSLKSLLAIPVGIKQKYGVNAIVNKFDSSKFTVILFHYDGIVDEWSDLQWSGSALHVSAINQSKWWFAKRFLHPDIVNEYDYIFLWDEDIGVENFHPERYLEIVEREGLHISQPALDPAKSRVHHRITARLRKGEVHRRTYKLNGGGQCYANSTGPPCTGWVEMMVPVFSKAAWRCAWHMIQNDLIHAWGLDMKLGYCAQGDRSKNIGVVDSEYVVHKALPTLGGSDGNKDSSGISAAKDGDRVAVRYRSLAELKIFQKRWQVAVKADTCWIDSYSEDALNSTT